ncbi:hypothetical protein T190115A13A_80220 [Tenacibaculum sp. 190524A02b]|uniref:Uncharacterized protein n=1 Tax=Tenacibaculum vairaonense TaxID=3137860 RepID=A0ABM9PS87_9FLAO
MADSILNHYKCQMKRLSEKREEYINEYILPIEDEMAKLRDKIRNVEPDYNEY